MRPSTANLPGLSDVCLRIPAGGGKTIPAAHSVGVAADSVLRTDAPVVVWLVPPQAARDQMLATLQDRGQPNRRALADRFGGAEPAQPVAALHKENGK